MIGCPVFQGLIQKYIFLPERPETLAMMDLKFSPQPHPTNLGTTNTWTWSESIFSRFNSICTTTKVQVVFPAATKKTSWDNSLTTGVHLPGNKLAQEAKEESSKLLVLTAGLWCWMGGSWTTAASQTKLAVLYQRYWNSAVAPSKLWISGT